VYECYVANWLKHFPFQKTRKTPKRQFF
jgi:hypothetical protein